MYSLFLKSTRKAHTDGKLFIFHYLNFCCKKLHIIRTVSFSAKGSLKEGAENLSHQIAGEHNCPFWPLTVCVEEVVGQKLPRLET